MAPAVDSVGQLWTQHNRVEWGKMPPYCFPHNNHKIKSKYFFIVTMDYVDESDVEVFTMKLTLVMYRR